MPRFDLASRALMTVASLAVSALLIAAAVPVSGLV